MTKMTVDPRDGRATRRDFLATSAKAGAAATLAAAGWQVLSPSADADAASTTLTYIGLKDNANPNVTVEMLRLFEQQHPGVKTKFIFAPTGSADAYHDKLVTLFSAHDSSIDIADSDVIWQAQWAPAGWVAPLDNSLPVAQRKQYAPGMIWADTIGDHLYGIPWMLDTGHLYYRKDILDANGLKPAKTWPELAQQLTMLLKKYPTMIGFVPCYQKGQQLICNFMEYAWSNGGDLIDDKTGKVVFNSPQNVQALQFMMDLIKHKLVQPGVVSMNLDPEGRQLFTTGKAIYHRNWNYVYALSQDTKGGSKVAGKVGVTDIPHFAGHSTASCAGGWQYVVNNYSKNKDLALKLAVFLGGPAMQKYRALHGSFSPAYLPANDDPAVVGKFPSYPLLAQQAKTERSRSKTALWTQISQTAEAELSNALTFTKTAKQALDDASSKITSVMSGEQ